MTLEEYYKGAMKRMREKKGGERYGQALFNHLEEVRPDLANKVRTTVYDPFYAHTVKDKRVVQFDNFLEKSWK